MRQYTLGDIFAALDAEKNMPAALYADAARSAKKTATENPDYAWALPYFRAQVEKYKTEPIEAPGFQAYADWERRGARGDFDRAMYALRTRLNTMALATLLDVEGAKEAYEDILYAFLHLPTWSLSAHYLYGGLNDYWDIPKGPFDETGHVRGLGRDRRQSLDLCSTSAAFMLCEMAQLLEGRVEPCLLRWSRQESFERVLSPFMSLAPFPHFETNPNNWSGVCMSSMGAAAIYLIVDPHTLAPVLKRVLDGLSVHLSGYNDDGASPEGFGYWQYGFEYFLMFADLLARRTGGRIDLLDDEKTRRVAGFGADCCFGTKLKLPFGDAVWLTAFNEGIQHYVGVFDEAVRRRVGHMGVTVPPKGDAFVSFDAAFEHCPLQLRHLVWTMEPKGEAERFPRSAVYPTSEYFMGFYRRREDPVYLLAKGGNNGESHNHNDVGSYVVIRGDEMLAADTAGGQYCRDYFNENRYTFFAARSGGHNLPIVGGVEQEGNGRCRAKKFAVERGEDEDRIEIDLTGTLACPQLVSLNRRLTGVRATGAIVVEDRFGLSAPVEIIDRVVVLDEPEKLAEDALRVGGEKGMTLRFDGEQLDCRIAPVDHSVAGHAVYTIDLIPRQPRAGETIVCVRWDAE